MLEISINKCFALTFLTYEDKVTNLKHFTMILAQALRNVRNMCTLSYTAYRASNTEGGGAYVQREVQSGREENVRR